MKKKKTSIEDIRDPLNEAIGEINYILNHCQKEKYYYAILLSFSLLEFLLKWIICIENIWQQTLKYKHKELESLVKKLQEYFARMTPYNLIQQIMPMNKIDLKLYNKLEKMRKDRNEIVHKFWIKKVDKDFRYFRNKLAFYALNLNALMGVFNRISRKVGIEEIFGYEEMKRLLK